MSGLYGTHGWPGDHPDDDRRSRGTPLGRIVLGVFLGLLTWTVVLVAIAFALATTVLKSVDDTFDSSNAASSLSSK